MPEDSSCAMPEDSRSRLWFIARFLRGAGFAWGWLLSAPSGAAFAAFDVELGTCGASSSACWGSLFATASPSARSAKTAGSGACATSAEVIGSAS